MSAPARRRSTPVTVRAAGWDDPVPAGRRAATEAEMALRRHRTAREPFGGDIAPVFGDQIPSRPFPVAPAGR